jgi:hypothetical protein
VTTNLDLAKQVADHVALQSVTLKSAAIDTALDPLALPAQVGMTQGYRSSFDRFPTEGREKLVVTVDFKFNAKEGDDAPSDLVALSASFSLIYWLEPDVSIDDRCFRHFAELNGPYNAWPYWRELVQSVTGRVGMAGVTIPVFRVSSAVIDDQPAEEPSKAEKPKARKKPTS